MYGELRLFHRFERLPDTLQRLDFILFDLIPTLSTPFYLVYLVLLFGAADALLFLGAIYFLLLWISIFNMALAFIMFNRSIGFFGLAASLIFPFYQGVFLKCGRFFAYSAEIISATSRRDDFVPPRVLPCAPGDSDLRNRRDECHDQPSRSTCSHPVENRRRAAGRFVRIAYAAIVYGVIGFFVAYFGAPFVFLSGPGTVSSASLCNFASLCGTGQRDEACARRHGQGRRGDRTGALAGARQHRRNLYACNGGHRWPHGGIAHQGAGREKILEAVRCYLHVTEEAVQRLDTMTAATVTFRMEVLREHASARKSVISKRPRSRRPPRNFHLWINLSASFKAALMR